MTEIIKRDIKILITTEIVDDDFIGVLIGKEKYIVVSKTITNSCTYNLMNTGLHLCGNNYAYVRTLLDSVKYTQAFKFATRQEMFNWFIIPQN